MLNTQIAKQLNLRNSKCKGRREEAWRLERAAYHQTNYVVSASLNLNSKTSLQRTEEKRGLGERLGLVGEGLEIRGSDGGEEGILGQ